MPPDRDETAKKCRAAFPALYSAIWPDLVATARARGYALLIHGSLRRDLDLVAVPWTDDAVPCGELVDAVRAACDGWVGDTISGRWTLKPHGRKAWTIILHGHATIDLSVMPRMSHQGGGTDG